MKRLTNVKRITKIKRSARAISPVIATLLMIAIAVVASLVAYAWVMGYLGTTTSKVGKSIQIPSFTSSGGNLVVYVQNVGQGEVELKQLESVYLNDVLFSITSPNTATIPIPVGQTVELITNAPYATGQQATIKIVTSDGASMQTTGSGGSSGNTQTQAAINLNPLSGLAGSGVSISGSGFAASTTLSATFAGGAITLGGVTSTDASGAFTGATFNVPAGASPGASAVVFTAGTTSGSATFTVTTAGTGKGTIIVYENSEPDAAQNFEFSGSGDIGGLFSFNDLSGGTTGTPFPLTDLTPGTYTIVQTAVSNWPLTSILPAPLGDVQSRTATITVAADTTYTVTFTNTQNSAPVTVTFQTGGTGTGSVSPTGSASYAVGASFTATATLTGGSTFGGWSANPVGCVTFADAGVASTTVTIVAAGTVTATLNPAGVGPLDHFVFSAISGTKVAGTAITGITITAVDSASHTVTSYAGTVTLTETDGGAGGSVTQSPVTFSSGVWSGSLTVTKSGTGVTITASGDGKTGKSNTFNVNPGTFDHFGITVPSSCTSHQYFGTGSNVIVTAYDANNNVVTSYTGSVYFTTSDASGSARVPYSSSSRYTFTVGDAGIHTFAGTGSSPGFRLITAPSQTITVTDGTHQTTSSSITVNPGAFDQLVFSTIGNQQSGVAFSVTITAQDQDGNTVTSFSGAQTLRANNLGTGGTISPTSITFANGVWSSSAVTITVSSYRSNVYLYITYNSNSYYSNYFNVNH
jgi:flagellin-like protein